MQTFICVLFVVGSSLAWRGFKREREVLSMVTNVTWRDRSPSVGEDSAELLSGAKEAALYSFFGSVEHFAYRAQA